MSSGFVAIPVSKVHRTDCAYAPQNVLAGALFSPLLATILLTLLTTLGSLCSTLLATPLAPILTYLFPRALDLVRNALGDQSAPLDEKRPNVIAPALTRADSATDISYPPVPPVSVTPPSRTASPANEVFEEKQLEAAQVENTTPTWIRLAILRLVGIVPWSGINIACGVCGVSLWDCMLGNLVGTLPWTAVTCQVRIGWPLFSCIRTDYPARSAIFYRRLPRTREKKG